MPNRCSPGRYLFVLLTLALAPLPASAGIAPPIDDGGCDTSACGAGACGTIKVGTCFYACGTCPSGQTCTNNVCVAPCTPTTSCAAAGLNCGTLFDGCTTVSCGTCQSGWTCSTSQVCQPPPPPDGEILCNGTRVYASGEEPRIFDMVCGVGTLDGAPAINWLGHWFVLASSGLSGWTLTNDASNVVPLSVAPVDVDTGDITTDPDIDVEFTIGTEVSRPPPPSPTLPELRTRSYSFTIGGRPYTFEASQRIFDHMVSTSAPLRIRGDVLLRLVTPEPSDGTTWTVIATPERALPDGTTSQAEPPAEDAEAAGASSIGDTGTLFTSRNVIFSPTVDLVSAVRTTPPRTTQAVAEANPALNRAVGAMMGSPSQLYSVFADQAVNVNGSVLGVSGSDVVSFDKQRLAQFYMSTRSSSGFSNQGTDRPLLDTGAQSWTFRQPIVHYSQTFPFLAGICGLTVDVDSFLAGSFQASAQTCFDGLPVSASAQGSISFSLEAGGGFGCSIIIASASAGLQSHVGETLEFGSSVQAAPPELDAFVRLYTQLDFDAFFKVRVLFWSHKWSKHLSHEIIFQREIDEQVLPQFTDFDACELLDPDTADDGTEDLTHPSGCDVPVCAPNGTTCADVIDNTACITTTVYPTRADDSAFFSYPLPGNYRDPATGNVVFQNATGGCTGRWHAPRPANNNSLHNGIDIYAPAWTPVTPVRDGVVASVNTNPGAKGGLSVTLISDAPCAGCKPVGHSYSHLALIDPRVLAAIHDRTPVVFHRGETIGFAGHTGNACGQQHLHFSMIDPTRPRTDAAHYPSPTASFFSVLPPSWALSSP